MTAQNAFRGIKGIQEIKAKYAPLVKFYSQFKPATTELVMSKTDYDLVARWPRAANVEGFLTSDNGIYWDGLRLTYDTSEGRYNKASAPEQAEIT